MIGKTKARIMIKMSHHQVSICGSLMHTKMMIACLTYVEDEFYVTRVLLEL